MRSIARVVCLFTLLGASCARFNAQQPVLVPQVVGEFWKIASNPDLGKYTTAKQQPVDFGIWQAADGTWQLWSCIRGTAIGGESRLFYHWQANKLIDTDWTPMGIAMLADPGFGETEGGLQAPYVLKVDDEYYMFYGTWTHIAVAKSKDGKTFARQLMPDGKSGLFSEGKDTNTRDPMVIRVRDHWNIYYSAFDKPHGHGFVYARTSKDLLHWSGPTKVAYGGSAGDGWLSAECPWVYFEKTSGYYYLLRNQFYGAKAQFSVYRSKDPMDFGREDDSHLMERLPYAAPEIVESAGQLYLAVLLPGLNGIQLAKLTFAPKP